MIEVFQYFYFLKSSKEIDLLRNRTYFAGTGDSAMPFYHLPDKAAPPTDYFREMVKLKYISALPFDKPMKLEFVVFLTSSAIGQTSASSVIQH